jgi:hypothetical protein
MNLPSMAADVRRLYPIDGDRGPAILSLATSTVIASPLGRVARRMEENRHVGVE